MGEFELIDHCFKSLTPDRSDVVLGIGDDAALLRPPPGTLLVACVDTLVEGVHFPADMAAADIGYRAAAVNLSDLAAMGAIPRWALLALSLPVAEDAWLAGFAEGLRDALLPAGVALVGGDTTRGPLTVSVQLLGLVPDDGSALTRGGARTGDVLCVSGTVGDAAGGLARWGQDAPDSPLLRRFRRPTARLALGQGLRGIASACIDVSDGLLADAGHIAQASGCGLVVEPARLPLSEALGTTLGSQAAVEAALSGGDDYELCFCVPPARLAAVEALAARVGCPITVIGEVVSGSGIELKPGHGLGHTVGAGGYRHF